MKHEWLWNFLSFLAIIFLLIMFVYQTSEVERLEKENEWLTDEVWHLSQACMKGDL